MQTDIVTENVTTRPIAEPIAEYFNNPNIRYLEDKTRDVNDPLKLWFCASDIGKVIGHSQIRKVLSRSTDINASEIIKVNIYAIPSQFIVRNLTIPADELFDVNNNGTSCPVDDGTDITSKHGATMYTFVTERAMYSLLLDAKTPKALKLREWVITNVLPSIRRHGAYIDDYTLCVLSNNPNAVHELTQSQSMYNNMAQVLHKENEKLKTQIENDKEFTELGKCVSEYADNISIGALAGILAQNGYPTGEHKLAEELRNDGFLCKFGANYNKPYQKFINAGIMTICYTNESCSTWTPMITNKGIQYFVNFYINKMRMAIACQNFAHTVMERNVPLVATLKQTMYTVVDNSIKKTNLMDIMNSAE